MKAKVLWQKTFEYRRSEFPSICLLAEIVLCLGPSNSIAEKGFSQLTAMLSDRRLSMGVDTMDDLLLVKVNNLSWTVQERDEIIDMALENYMKTRRKLQIDTTPFRLLGVDRKRRRNAASDDLESDTDQPTGVLQQQDDSDNDDIDNSPTNDNSASSSESSDDEYDPVELVNRIEAAADHLHENSDLVETDMTVTVIINLILTAVMMDD